MSTQVLLTEMSTSTQALLRSPTAAYELLSAQLVAVKINEAKRKNETGVGGLGDKLRANDASPQGKTSPSVSAHYVPCKCGYFFSSEPKKCHFAFAWTRQKQG
jgi:hypothetical protein